MTTTRAHREPPNVARASTLTSRTLLQSGLQLVHLPTPGGGRTRTARLIGHDELKETAG